MAQPTHNQTGADERTAITLCCPLGVDDPVGRWLGPLVRAWGDADAPPQVQVATLGSIVQDPLPASIADRPQGVLVAVLPADEPVRSAYELLHHVRRTGRPAVFLFERLDEPRRAIGDEGIIVEQWDVSIDELVRTIRVLVARQPSMLRLSRELETAESIMSGSRSKMGDLLDEVALAGAVQGVYLGGSCPRVPGLDVAKVRCAGEGVRSVLCDVSCLDENLVRFFMADALSTGVSAALMTLLFARSLGRMHNVDAPATLYHPAEALARLNTDLCDRSLGGGHTNATAVYGVLDLITGECTIAGAGHPSPFIVRPDGGERVRVCDAILGVEPNALFEETTIIFEPGVVLALGSAGFRKAMQSQLCDAQDRKAGMGCVMTHAAKAARETGSLDSSTLLIEHALGQREQGQTDEDAAALWLGYRLADFAEKQRAA